MAKTGERYTAARRNLLGPTGSSIGESQWVAGSGLLHLPGINPETTGLRVLLANLGVRLPHSGEAPSEAMVLGIGGGLGAGVFAFHYQEVSTLFLAGRHLWDDGSAFVQNACGRLGVTVELRETGGAKTAARHLEAALATGQPALAWLDVTRLPYRGDLDHHDQGSYHVVSVYDVDGEQALIGDLATAPVQVSAADLAAARGRVKKVKNRLLSLTSAAADLDLERAIRDGVRASIEGLTGSQRASYRSNFQLKAFEALAKRMQGDGKQGWGTVFPSGRRLWGALQSLYRFVEHEGSGGGLLRPLYASFLSEAAEALGDDRFREPADRYRALGARWTALARSALPAEVPAFAEARALHDAIAGQLADQGAGAQEGLRASRTRLQQLAIAAGNAFPLTAADTDALLGSLADQLHDIHRLEEEALLVLEGAGS